MTLVSPIVGEFAHHLSNLLLDPYLEPDYDVLIEIEDKFRYDKLIDQDPSILPQLAPLLLQIINSNETTKQTKAYAIKFLDILLPYYPSHEILKIFNEDLLIEAFKKGNDYLKLVISKLLQRLDGIHVSKISSTSLFLFMLKSFADPNTDLATVNQTQKAIVSLTLKSDEIRQKFLNDYEITHILNDMKSDKIIQSRLIDLVIEILPVIPNLPTSLYLVSETEIAASNDVLFYRFCSNTWLTLLNLVDKDESLIFLKEKMKPQFDFCCRKFINEDTLISNKECFIDYDDFGSVYLIATLSFVFPDLFRDLDGQYKLVDYSIGSYTRFTKSVKFLSTVNTIFLRKKDFLFENFRLSDRYTDIFIHLIMDKTILDYHITKERYPETVFENLVFENNFRIFEVMCTGSAEQIQKLINDWPLLIRKVISTNILNNLVATSMDLLKCLNILIASEIPMDDDLREAIGDKIDKLNGKVFVSVEEPLTQSM